MYLRSVSNWFSQDDHVFPYLYRTVPYFRQNIIPLSLTIHCIRISTVLYLNLYCTVCRSGSLVHTPAWERKALVTVNGLLLHEFSSSITSYIFPGMKGLEKGEVGKLAVQPWLVAGAWRGGRGDQRDMTKWRSSGKREWRSEWWNNQEKVLRKILADSNNVFSCILPYNFR